MGLLVPYQPAMMKSEGRMLLALAIVLLVWGLLFVGFALGVAFSMVMLDFDGNDAIAWSGIGLAIGLLMILGHCVYLARSK